MPTYFVNRYIASKQWAEQEGIQVNFVFEHLIKHSYSVVVVRHSTPVIEFFPGFVFDNFNAK